MHFNSPGRLWRAIMDAFQTVTVKYCGVLRIEQVRPELAESKERGRLRY